MFNEMFFTQLTVLYSKTKHKKFYIIYRINPLSVQTCDSKKNLNFLLFAQSEMTSEEQ